MATTEEKEDTKEAPVEQSEASHLLEHHLKIQQLERKVGYLQGEIDAIEARRERTRKFLLQFLAGVCYGLVLAFIFDL